MGAVWLRPFGNSIRPELGIVCITTAIVELAGPRRVADDYVRQEGVPVGKIWTGPQSRISKEGSPKNAQGT